MWEERCVGFLQEIRMGALCLCFDSVSSGRIVLFVWCWRTLGHAAFDKPLDQGLREDSLGGVKNFTLPCDVVFA